MLCLNISDEKAFSSPAGPSHVRAGCPNPDAAEASVESYILLRENERQKRRTMQVTKALKTSLVLMAVLLGSAGYGRADATGIQHHQSYG
jgi:hypothetical protein